MAFNAPAGWPNIKVEIALTSTPLSTSPVWTDVTAYVESFDTKMGRNYELADFQTGTLNLTLDNADGRFTPGNASGAYYPNIQPGRPIRVTAVQNSVTYNVFYGQTESFNVSYPGGGDFSQCEVSAVDMSKYLSNFTLGSPLTEVTTARSALIFYSKLNEEPKSKSVANRGIAGWVKPTGTVVGSKLPGGFVTFGNPGITEYTEQSMYMEAGNSSYTVGKAIRFDMDKTWYSTHGSAPGFTVDGWFKTPVAAPTGRMHLMGMIDEYNGGTAWQWFVHMLADGRIQARVYDSGNNIVLELTSTNAYNDGEWHFIQFSAQPNSLIWVLRVDSLGEGSVTLTTAPTWNMKRSALYIGGLYYIGTKNMQYAATGYFSHWALRESYSAYGTGQAQYAAGTGGGSYAGDSETTRIGRVLDWASWPSAWRSLDTGLSTLQSMNVAGTGAMDAIKEAATAAGGYAYIGRDGNLVYKNRQYRLNKAISFSLSEGEHLMPERDIVFEHDDQNLLNSVRVHRLYGADYLIEDDASITAYGKRQDSLELAIDDDLEAYDAGSWRVYLYANPITRLPNITFMPSTGTNQLWDESLGLDIGDVIRLDTMPANVPTTNQDFFIESISHRVTQGQWYTTFELSPADKHRGVWILDDATYSILDNTTILVY